MPAIKLVRPVGRDQLYALSAQIAGQEREQVAGRAIGPVHVLEHEHERISAREAAQEAEDQLEQPSLRHRRRRAPVLLAGLELGKQWRQFLSAERRQLLPRRGIELPHPRTQCLDERPEGKPSLLQVQATADEADRAVGFRAREELLDQPGLADPRLAGDDERRGAPLSSRLEARHQQPELVGPAHEARTRHVAAHAGIISGR